VPSKYSNVSPYLLDSPYVLMHMNAHQEFVIIGSSQAIISSSQHPTQGFSWMLNRSRPLNRLFLVTL